MALRIFVAARMRDLVPRPGIEPRPPALGAWSLNHSTTREVQEIIFLNEGYKGYMHIKILLV